MTDTTAAAAEITLTDWTNPTTGQHRRYLDGWEEAIGLRITRYHTGNISHATLDGAVISHAEGGRMLGKVWLDDADKLHVDHYAGRTLSARQVAQRITTAMHPEITSTQGA